MGDPEEAVLFIRECLDQEKGVEVSDADADADADATCSACFSFP
jgi:hypothetical protein